MAIYIAIPVAIVAYLAVKVAIGLAWGLAAAPDSPLHLTSGAANPNKAYRGP